MGTYWVGYLFSACSLFHIGVHRTTQLILIYCWVFCLLFRLGIEDLDLILRERRLRWYGHVERSSGAVKIAFDIQVNGKRGPGRPKMT